LRYGAVCRDACPESLDDYTKLFGWTRAFYGERDVSRHALASRSPMFVEKEFGLARTTRNWNTIEKVAKILRQDSQD
jgi:uncharacterized protein (DUF1697 family)